MVELLSGPWGPVLIFLLRACDVSLATTRFLLLVRGHRVYAPLIGFVEILIWVVAAGVVIQNLTSFWHVMGYAGGFTAGTAAGMWLEEKLALGVCTVRAFVREPQDVVDGIVAELREVGFGVTQLEGRGRAGPVGILYTVVGRRRAPEVVDRIESLDPDAFVTVQNDAAVRRGWFQAMRRR